MPEILFIFVLALILFGPRKLPEIGKQIGRALNEFKRASREFQSQIEDEVRDLEMEAELKEMKNTILPPTLEGIISTTPPAGTVSSPAASSPEVARAAQSPEHQVG